MDCLQIEKRRDGSEDHFVVRGELDLASAPQLRTALLDALTGSGQAGQPARALLVDISEVRFLDCTAVGMLLQVRRRAEPEGCTLRVTGASGVVLEVLETAGVAKRLGVYDEPAPAAPGPTDHSDERTVSMLDTMSQLSPGSHEHTRIRDYIVAECTPLATSLARRFSHRGEPFDDLYQVAMVGLLKAVDRYDPGRGRRFVAYATPTILGELRRHFRDRTWAMTVPRRHKEMRLRLNAAREELAHRLGRSPSVADLASHLRASTDEVLEAIEAAQAYQSVSLFMPIGGEETITLADLVGSNDPDLDAVENRAALPTMIAQLPEREQRILAMRFYGDMTQSQIAERTGISQMHVSRLLKGALGRLREKLLQAA